MDLLRVHEEIDRALESACCEALAGQGSAWMTHLDTVLRAHIHDEDTGLIPAWQELEPNPGRIGNPELFLQEHRRIEAKLEEATGAAGVDRVVVLRRLHHLLEHHDQRERESLKPGLDRLLTPQARSKLLSNVEWGRPPPPPAPPLDSAAIADRWAALRPRLKTLSKPFDKKAAHLSAEVEADLAERPLHALDRMLTLENILAAAARM